MKNNTNKQILIGFSGLGIILFSFVFLATIFLAKPLEKTAVEFLTTEVSKQVNTKLDKLLGINSLTPNVAQKLFLAKYEEEVPVLKVDIERTTTSIKNELLAQDTTSPSDIVITETTDVMTLTSKLWDYKIIKAGLKSLGTEMAVRYEATWAALVTDIRIFSSVNVGSFCLILVLVILLKEIPRYVSVCVWWLLLSTFASISIYIYGQNWFYTILFNQYYGTGYLVMLSCIFGYLFIRFSLEYGMHIGIKKFIRW